MKCHDSSATLAVAFDYVMIILASFCLIMTIYGTFKYLKFWKLRDNEKMPASIFCVGFMFFIISSITLITALLYDVLYLFCSNLDKYQGSIYHSTYFVQIYSLWMMLFLRIYYLFKNSRYGLNKCIIIAYKILFIFILLILSLIYILFGLEADSLIILPIVALSIIVCTSLSITFVYKLYHAYTQFGGGNQLLLNTMARNILLTITSLIWTIIVFIVLICLEIKYKGHYEKHSVLEELILELFILSDIISNFLCVLLSFAFFTKQYDKFCGILHGKLFVFFEQRLSERIKDKRRDKPSETNQIDDEEYKNMEDNKTIAMDAVSLALNDGNNKIIETDLISTDLIQQKKSLKSINSWTGPIIHGFTDLFLNTTNSNNNNNNNNNNNIRQLRSINSAPARLNNN